MGDHCGASKIIGKLVHHLGKLTGVLDMLRADAMDSYIESGKAHVARPDHPLLYAYNPAVLDPGKADRTSACALFVGGFEIDCNGFQWDALVGLLRLLATGK
jgi:hypothetical protein